MYSLLILTIFFPPEITKFQFFQWKNSWKFVYNQVTKCRTSFILTIFFPKKQNSNFFQYKKIVRVCLQSSYKVQNLFHFDEFFSPKNKIPNFSMKKIRNQITKCRTPFILTNFVYIFFSCSWNPFSWWFPPELAFKIQKFFTHQIDFRLHFDDWISHCSFRIWSDFSTFWYFMVDSRSVYELCIPNYPMVRIDPTLALCPFTWMDSRKTGNFCTLARCLKITEKVSFNIASEASYVYILSGQKLIKNAKNGSFWRVFENLKLAVKQCYQTGQF